MTTLQSATSALLPTTASVTGTAAAAKATTAASPATAASPTTGAGGAVAAPDAAADRFLTLLVTQLRNQDPLNPLDNAQITSQLAQLSTVSGINKLNDAFASLQASFQANQYLQATGLVGHDVTVAGNKLTLTDGTSNYGIAFGASADHVTVTIADASGRVVRTIDAGNQPAGVSRLAWDGRADNGSVCADGAYTVSVTASSGGKPVAADSLTIARVTGIVPGNNGTLLQLGSLGIVDLAQVLQFN